MGIFFLPGKSEIILKLISVATMLRRFSLIGGRRNFYLQYLENNINIVITTFFAMASFSIIACLFLSALADDDFCGVFSLLVSWNASFWNCCLITCFW